MNGNKISVKTAVSNARVQNNYEQVIEMCRRELREALI